MKAKTFRQAIELLKTCGIQDKISFDNSLGYEGRLNPQLLHSETTANDFAFLADYLKSGQAPDNICLQLFRLKGNIASDAVKFLADAIKSENCPSGLKISLLNVELNLIAINYLAQALMTRKHDKQLILDLSGWVLNYDDVVAMLQSLSSAHNLSNVTLILGVKPYHGDVEILINSILSIIERVNCNNFYLKVNRTGGYICPIDFFSIQQPSPTVTTTYPTVSVSNIKEISETSLYNLMSAGQVCGGLHLELEAEIVYNENERDEKYHRNLVVSICRALRLGVKTENIVVKIGGYCFNADDLRLIADALSSGQCPRSLTLDISKRYDDSQIVPPDVERFEDALLDGNCPEDLTVLLPDSGFGRWYTDCRDIVINKEIFCYKFMKHINQFSTSREKAKQGDIDALYTLGTYYENGTGVHKNIDKALKIYKFASNFSNTDAISALCRLSVSGVDVTNIKLADGDIKGLDDNDDTVNTPIRQLRPLRKLSFYEQYRARFPSKPHVD